MAEGKGHTELPSVIWMRDLDGTGSMHPCAKGDAGAVAYVPEDSVNSYPAVDGLVKALEGIEKGGTAVLLDAALSDAPEGFDECPINPKVLEQIVNDSRSALSRFRSLQNGGAND